MLEQKRKRERKIKGLAILVAFVAVIFGVSTFAWFIGMRTVHVSPFDIKIAGVGQLSLSLDGETWSDTVTINEGNYATAYAGNTNWWAGDGLIPMSSLGVMDSAASRMVLYEKASLTATPGGYRLMTSKVPNEAAQPEQDGYVAFDLFVKNLSGTQYIEELQILDEEAVYLTVGSEANVASSGVEKTGIENSVRVGFAQIGRVIGTTPAAKASVITGIKCEDDPASPTDPEYPTTGICSDADRPAVIWEPNDRKHELNATNFYDEACRLRTGVNVTLPASYDVDKTGGSCGKFIDGLPYPTYASNDAIVSENNVDVYDGAEYNEYEATTKLTKQVTFTDSDKLLRGMERAPLMYLAPNSITKVRIYVWLEGQDVDNYDFAAIGKKISVNFGFTKERFEEEDTGYDGPTTNEGKGPDALPDAIVKTPPVIILDNLNPTTLPNGTAYDEAIHGGVVSAFDSSKPVRKDLSLTPGKVEVSGTVNEDVPGTYEIVYKVTDEYGNVATKVRYVIVAD